MLAELFQVEDTARDMATKLMRTAKESKSAAAGERESLLAFLRGPLERHMAYEEATLFPALRTHGLASEVQVAQKQHQSIRLAADKLADLPADADAAQLIFDTARLLVHHTNFEGDYIYPELTHAEWRELIKGTLASGVAT